MNILLIGPFTGKISYPDAEAKMYMEKMFLAPPLGIHRIATYLKQKYNVEVFDPNLEDPYAFLNEEAQKYQVIGFSMTHPTLEHDLSLVWHAKKCNPDSLLIAGGEEAVFNHSQVFRFSPIDLVVLGEGEMPMFNICEKITQSKGNNLKNLRDIPGLLIREGEKTISTGYNSSLDRERFLEVTKSLNFGDIPYEKYWSFMEGMYDNDKLNDDVYREVRTIRMFTSNYCPYRCTFCSSTNFHEYSCGKRPKFTLVSAEDLLLMIKRTIGLHPLVKTIFFHDDNFTLGRQGQERAVELCNGIIKYKQQNIIPKNLSFMCQNRVSDVSKHMLELMSEAGFRMVSYGVESFSQNILNEFNKKISLNQIENALNWTYMSGIKIFINIILTSPNCRLSDVWLTATECVKHLKLGSEIGLNPYLMPFPGADILKGEGIQDLIVWRKAKIPGTSITFNNAERILPKDEEVRGLLTSMQAELDYIYMKIRSRVSSAKKSILTLYSLFLAFERLDVYKEEAENHAGELKIYINQSNQ